MYEGLGSKCPQKFSEKKKNTNTYKNSNHEAL